MGVAIARECARAGKRTLLVEQHDFGSGTTSRSSRMLSGLRPLEQGGITFAREALREREGLLRGRSHLARPAQRDPARTAGRVVVQHLRLLPVGISLGCRGHRLGC